MLENIDPIVLDGTNNVFVGPNGYFSIVVDEFDGETIQAWYVEDSAGNRTPNLAARAGGRHVDVLINKDNRTVTHFFDRISGNLIAEEQAMRTDLESRMEMLAALQAELAEMAAAAADDMLVELAETMAEVLAGE